MTIGISHKVIHSIFKGRETQQLLEKLLLNGRFIRPEPFDDSLQCDMCWSEGNRPTLCAVIWRYNDVRSQLLLMRTELRVHLNL